MKKILMILAAMMAVLSSCSKNEIELIPENESKDIVLNISVSDPCAETKALIKKGWVNDDIISIWFDKNTGTNPDLVIKYDAGNTKWIQKKDAQVSGNKPSTGDGKYAKALYNGTVKVASKDSYTYKDSTLTFNIQNWKFLTELQVVVTNLEKDQAGKYTLACDKFTPISGAGYIVDTLNITALKGTEGSAVPGISNEDGVAFVFATADYSANPSDNKDFIFTLRDGTSGSKVAKFYEPNVAIAATDGHKTIKALITDNSKFVVPSPLSGVFSVSATKKVRFSKGNLVASIDASGHPIAWKFAAHQYDCIGEGGANKTIGTAAGYVDLFGWSTDAELNNWGIHTMQAPTDKYTTGNFKDWGKAIDDTRRTLTTEEWRYLLGNSPEREDKAFLKTVCGKENCLILLPDDYPDDKEVPEEYDAKAWAQAEEDGLVCLPLTGFREGSEVKNTYIGYYWSSSKYGDDQACCLNFYKDNDDGIAKILPNNSSLRRSGLGVRLVTDVK